MYHGVDGNPISKDILADITRFQVLVSFVNCQRKTIFVFFKDLKNIKYVQYFEFSYNV